MTAVDPLVAAWEARPADPDGLTERMARAMWESQRSHYVRAVPTWEQALPSFRREYRRLAVAALQVVKAPAGDPHPAVQRVVEELERPEEPQSYYHQGLIQGRQEAAAQLRAALSGGAQ